VEFGERGTNTIIELTYNWQTHQYDLGAIGHLAPGVKDIYKRATACQQRRKKLLRSWSDEAYGNGDRVHWRSRWIKIELLDLSRRGQAKRRMR